MLAYAIAITPDDNGTYLVTAPDLPEVTTFSETTDDELLRRAIDAIEEAIAARMAADRDVPFPGPAAGMAVAKLPILTSIKTMLYVAARTRGVSRAELGERLGWPVAEVDDLFRLGDASHFQHIDEAFGALGQELHFEVKSAA